MMAEETVKIAMFQGTPDLGEVQKNVESMKAQIIQAKKMGADVIVFPELYTSGYKLNNDLMKELAEKKDGKTFFELSECARSNNIGVLYGYPELDYAHTSNDYVYYNSVQFIDKCGVALANYRKMHLWLHETDMERVFTPGNDFAKVFKF